MTPSRSPRRVWRWAARSLVAAALAGGAAAAIFIATPLPDGLLSYQRVASTRVLDRQGVLLREFTNADGTRAVPLGAGEIPPRVKAAFLAAEDEGFDSHPGVSVRAVLRAAWQNASAGRVVAGGSTITQQLARLLVPRERTLLGKVGEALWAMRLEAHASKPEILAQYLSRIPLGNGLLGVQAAANVYFGRDAAALSWAEAATLAAIPKGPALFNPYRHPDRLAGRQRWVLGRLLDSGQLSADEAQAFGSESTDLQAFDHAFLAPHFVEQVRRWNEAQGDRRAAEINTTLDAELQRDVEDVVRDELRRLEGRAVSSAAVLVLDNATGEVLAYVGSKDFGDEETLGQNDGVRMRRQPGSTLKPFVYAESFARGQTAARVLSDIERTFGEAGRPYAPKNYDRKTHGPVRAREALANSYNVPAVEVADQLGVPRVLERLRAAGFDSLTQPPEYYGLGLVLGDGEVSLWELARAYAGLARGGVVHPLTTIQAAKEASGARLPIAPDFERRRFVSRDAALLVTDILSDNAARVRAFGNDSVLRLPFPVAAKTGTSKGYSDNWTVGFTQERTVAVWAGNFDGSPMQLVSGISGAGPMFRRVMLRAMRNVAPAPLISDVDRQKFVTVEICPLSGLRAGPHCAAHAAEHFLRGTAPTAACDMHDGVAAVPGTDAAEACGGFKAAGRVTDFGGDFYAWAEASGVAVNPWAAPGCRATSRPDGQPTTILSPSSGDEFLVLNDLPLRDQAIPVRVRAPAGTKELSLRLDGAAPTVMRAPFHTRLHVSPGEHRLSVFAPGADAPLATVAFVVRSR